jgi:hypothetical protein
MVAIRWALPRSTVACSKHGTAVAATSLTPKLALDHRRMAVTGSHVPLVVEGA